jgi:hypothetical protein
MPMADLARAAGVSVRMIVRIENVPRLRKDIELARDADRRKDRMRKNLLRVLAQVALAGELDPAEWIKLATPDLHPHDLADILTIAKEKQVRAYKSNLGRIDSFALQQEHAVKVRTGRGAPSPRVQVTVVPYWPFATFESSFAESNSGSIAFLKDFIIRLVRSIDHLFTIDWRNDPDFHSVLFGGRKRRKLRVSPPEAPRPEEPQLVVGFLHQLQREFSFGAWSFVDVPGFRVRMAFLLPREFHKDSPSWRSILHGQPDEIPYKIIFIEGSTAENLLGGVCNLPIDSASGHQYGRIGKILDLNKMAHSIATELAANPRTIIVADECNADALRANALLSPFELTDIVPVADDDLVPAYPLGIATPGDNDRFETLLRRIIREELFTSHASVLARTYALHIVNTMAQVPCQPFRTCVAESIARYGENSGWPGLRIPSYLRIVGPEQWHFPPSFVKCLRTELALAFKKTFGWESPDDLLAQFGPVTP